MEKKPRVLVVEDERIVARDIKETLERFGYIVPAIISTGEEAVQEAGKTYPDLVLMDIMLKKEMNGIQAAKEIHDRFGIPVVYLTAHSDTNTVERAKKTMPYGYLLKPFNENDLRTTVEIALYKHEMERKLEESEQRFKSLFEHHPDAISDFDLKGNLLNSNPASGKLIGYSVKEQNQLSFKDFIIPEDLPKINHLLKATAGGEPRNLESTFIHKGARRIKVDINSIPIIVGEKIVGIYGIAKDITDRKRADEKVKQNYKKLQEALEGTVNALATAVEMRDPYTAGHQRRVAWLACAIAEEMNLTEEKIRGIHMAALIHDIGKINVPSEILSKPGRLTEIEFNMIKSHPRAGYDILKDIKFPWPVALIALQHHERMDGSGYPQGLLGGEICLEARIMAVADVVEAMSSHRPYRPALGIEKALEEISQNKSILYDPEVADACVKLFTEKGFAF